MLQCTTHEQQMQSRRKHYIQEACYAMQRERHRKGSLKSVRSLFVVKISLVTHRQTVPSKKLRKSSRGFFRGLERDLSSPEPAVRHGNKRNEATETGNKPLVLSAPQLVYFRVRGECCDLIDTSPILIPNGTCLLFPYTFDPTVAFRTGFGKMHNAKEGRTID